MTTDVRRTLMWALLGAAFVTAASVIVSFNAILPSDSVTLAVGQVAPSDIRAPRSITYDSDVLTNLARQSAIAAVRDVYDPPDPSVLRQQIFLARHTLDYIASVRLDSFSEDSQRISDLIAVQTVPIDAAFSETLLEISADDWLRLDDQVVGILERTMRNEIRESELAGITANLPNLVSVSIDEDLSDVIVRLTKPLVIPNAFFNAERTREARDMASARVQNQTRSFAQGQIVVRAGAIVSEADMEALQQLNVLQPPDRRAQTVGGGFLAVTMIGLLIVLTIRRFDAGLVSEPNKLILLGVLFIGALAGARIVNPADDFQSHLYPAAAFSLTASVLVSPTIGLMLTCALAVLVGVMLNGSLELTLMVAVGGTAAIVSSRRVERFNYYFRAGLVIGVMNVAVGLLFILMRGTTDPSRILVTLIACLLNGLLASGLGIVGTYFLSTILNLPTNLRLLELMQPSHPLLQRLLREAPGTYQHSLQVANLAELAAERIGANATLLRTAAMYHDVGKMASPQHFIENQTDGMNPHNGLPPHESARLIISHVPEGEKLARKYRLPALIVDFILQHHGTTLVLFFYSKAAETGETDKAPFTYPGPRPTSREAGILMLADASESTVRARRARTKQEIADIVRGIVQARLADGQLDNSKLTVSDLRTIEDVFVATLQGVFHPRINYPINAPATTTAEVTAASAIQGTVSAGEPNS
jgi:cyclic-di-AMP phosphodiesterase PgpH